MGTISKPKVLLAHNQYLERGGEDESFDVEKSLLLQHEHEICTYIRSNAELASYGWLRTLSLPFRTIHARDSRKDLRAIISTERPDIVHFNNTFPLISPAAYETCQGLGVPVVQNLRNYRLVCPNALFYRDHHVCEDCLGRLLPWPSILHACYRGSRVQSGVVAAMLAYHRLRRTWQTHVDAFVALTEFSRSKYIQGGIPAEKIVVRPNFVYDLGAAKEAGDYVLFVGRLAEGKGILGLLKAWRNCRNIPLKIIGDGPLRSIISTMVQSEDLPGIELCGSLPALQVSSMIRRARFVVFPSIWYEVFPRVIIEAFAAGRAVVVSGVGASPQTVEDGRNGLVFRVSDSKDLAEKVNYLWSRPDLCLEFGREARVEYESKYTPEIAYLSSMQIYERVLASK
jgi:glycosyltransferase involved in cell wall biosynthesis